MKRRNLSGIFIFDKLEGEEKPTPTLSISGSASLSGNQIKFTSNESVSAVQRHLQLVM